MCGIAGLIGTAAAEDPGVISAMLSAIRHRGPDDEGVWSEPGIWLGHRRLSIIDLSAAGRQPMVSACGRYVITLNGEIYNYRDLRAALECGRSIAWRGASDTEVLLETIARFGIDAALERASGMFAFGLWDRAEGAAHLVRDRFGEKPLCYAATAKGLMFASELSSLERTPAFDTTLSRAALWLYLRYGYVPAPYAIYEATRKLGPGEHLIWRAGEGAKVRTYWRLSDVVRAGAADRLTDSDMAIESLDRTLRAAVTRQMMSDAPLGAFLSGGIDSSLIAGVMQAVSPRPVRTFTLGFDSPEFNEADHARAVAAHLGTEHVCHVVTAADAQSIVPEMGAIFDEPFADSSQVPTWLLSRLARRDVTVCLTGDGGDEMFGGYVRYTGVPRLWKAFGALPGRGLLAGALEATPLPLIDSALAFLGPVARRYASRGALGASVRKAAGWLRARDEFELYEATMTAWPDPDALLMGEATPVAPWRPDRPAFDNAAEPMLWRDSVDYLPGDILCKVDRASMAHGLETRAPFLDPLIAAFAWRAPPDMKIRGDEGKWLVKQVLKRYVPADLTDRPKLGFSVPLHAWLIGALRPWAEDLLSPERLGREGVFRPAVVARAWQGLLNGDSGLAARVWTVLMFQSWRAARGG